MKPILPGHTYQLDHGPVLEFRRAKADRTIGEGTTTCELLELLIHRIESLDAKTPCWENKRTVWHLKDALSFQQNRRARIDRETSSSPCLRDSVVQNQKGPSHAQTH